jgi:hypothetical protein
MSDLNKYIADRKKKDPAFSGGFDERYEQFKRETRNGNEIHIGSGRKRDYLIIPCIR